MGDTLFGGEKSGTPVETRDQSAQLAKMFGQLASGGNPFQRMGAQSFANLFGVTPGDAGVPGSITDMLRDPSDQLMGLFKSMRPFEQRQTNEAVSGVRNMFGTMGGRFSRNVGGAESRVRSELSSEFGRNRENAILGANQQRGNFLAQLMSIAGQNYGNELNAMSRFLQPGAPVYTEGLLPGLISAAGNLGGMWMMGRNKTPPTTDTIGGGWDSWGDWDSPPPVPSGDNTPWYLRGRR